MYRCELMHEPADRHADSGIVCSREAGMHAQRQACSRHTNTQAEIGCPERRGGRQVDGQKDSCMARAYSALTNGIRSHEYMGCGGVASLTPPTSDVLKLSSPQEESRKTVRRGLKCSPRYAPNSSARCAKMPREVHHPTMEAVQALVTPPQASFLCMEPPQVLRYMLHSVYLQAIIRSRAFALPALFCPCKSFPQGSSQLAPLGGSPRRPQASGPKAH